MAELFIVIVPGKRKLDPVRLIKTFNDRDEAIQFSHRVSIDAYVLPVPLDSREDR